MLETSPFQIFHGGNSTFINSFDKIKFLFRVVADPLNKGFYIFLGCVKVVHNVKEFSWYVVVVCFDKKNWKFIIMSLTLLRICSFHVRVRKATE